MHGGARRCPGSDTLGDRTARAFRLCGLQTERVTMPRKIRRGKRLTRRRRSNRRWRESAHRRSRVRFAPKRERRGAPTPWLGFRSRDDVGSVGRPFLPPTGRGVDPWRALCKSNPVSRERRGAHRGGRPLRSEERQRATVSRRFTLNQFDPTCRGRISFLGVFGDCASDQPRRPRSGARAQKELCPGQVVLGRTTNRRVSRADAYEARRAESKHSAHQQLDFAGDFGGRPDERRGVRGRSSGLTRVLEAESASVSRADERSRDGGAERALPADLATTPRRDLNPRRMLR